MKIFIKRVKLFLHFFGFDARVFIYNTTGLFWYIRDYFAFKKAFIKQSDFKLIKLHPALTDNGTNSGNLTDHYFYQDLFVANRIYINAPIKHIDIGSRIDGFVAHVASFRKIEVFDIRPLTDKINNVKFIQTDFTNIDNNLIDYTDSVSCLHAIEHFGLGRYGDKIDPLGHIKGLEAIYAILKKGGKFYFSTPIGPQRVEFNAHRVFSVNYLFTYFKDKYQVDSFSYISDKNSLFENIILTQEGIENNFGCKYGCGIFELTKI